jgi:GNAT superfamily N-acetyltransferase
MKKLKFSIRVGTKADLNLLPDLENRTDQTYAQIPRFAAMFEREGLTVEQCHNLPHSSQIWMAHTDQPVGFAITRDIDDLTYLDQLSVVLEAQGREIGSALINIACEKAYVDGKRGIVLATFADVEFNGPLYAKRGFSTLSQEEMGPQLRNLAIEDEKEWGCFSPRVIMGRFFSDE